MSFGSKDYPTDSESSQVCMHVFLRRMEPLLGIVLRDASSPWVVISISVHVLSITSSICAVHVRGVISTSIAQYHQHNLLANCRW